MNITEEMDEMFCICGHRMAHHSYDNLVEYDIPEEYDWPHQWACHYGEKSKTETREDGVFVVVTEIKCLCTTPASLLKVKQTEDEDEEWILNEDEDDDDEGRWHNYV